MVTGVPCMCMRTTGTRAAAQRGRSSASKRPALTSFTRSAPASSAAAATSAFVVSTAMGTRTAARIARSTGRSRRRSSTARTGSAPGRVDSAPTSRSAAPSATIRAAASAARAGSRCAPPSENEAGVALGMPMTATCDSDTAPERVSSTGVSGAGLAGAEAAPASGRGGRRVPEATVLVPILPQDLVDLAPVDDLALEQRLGHLVQDLGVPAEEELRPLVRLEDDATDLVVDLDGRGLGVLRPLREVPPEEDLLLLLAVGDRPELLAHAPLAHHLPRQLGGALEIVARAGGHVAEHELFRGATAEEDREVVQEEAPRVGVAVVERDLLRQAEGHAARDDRHLVDGVGVGDELRHQRVSRLVVGGVPPLLEADDHRLPLRPHHDLVLRHLEVGHVDLVLVLASGEERRIGHVGAVGSGDEDDALVRLEAVHLDEQLVERLLPLVVAAAEARAAMAADGVDLVDEDDAGGVLLPLDEEVPHPRGADADEHLDEVGARDREEGQPGLAGDGAG